MSLPIVFLYAESSYRRLKYIGIKAIAGNFFAVAGVFAVTGGTLIRHMQPLVARYGSRSGCYMIRCGRGIFSMRVSLSHLIKSEDGDNG